MARVGIHGGTAPAPPSSLLGSQGRLPAPSSHRTGLALIASGSSGRRVVNPAAGRFTTSTFPKIQRELDRAFDRRVGDPVQFEDADEAAFCEIRIAQSPVHRRVVAQCP